MARRIGGLLGTLVALVAAAACMAPQASAAEVGVVSQVTWFGQSRADVDTEIQRLQTAGVQWIRANANWNELEPRGKGQIDAYTLANYDYAIAKARAAGIQVVMPIADSVPYWASSDPGRRINSRGDRVWNDGYPPRDMSDYGNIVRFVVEHFAPQGVHVYEMWNEPNLAWAWEPKPKAARYVKMLRAGSRAVRSADPSATVLLGGLATNDYRYLNQVYRNGGRRYFDAVAVHPYSGNESPKAKWYTKSGRLAPDSFPAIKEVRRTMVRRGDRAKKVWLTEFGWSTSSSDGLSGVRQADYLDQAFRYVERFRWVKAMFWYATGDHPYDDTGAYWSQFGLISKSGVPKLSYAALKAYAFSL